MHELLLASVYCDAVRTHPACASLKDVLQWRIPETKGEPTQPCVTFSARDVVPIGYQGYCTATLEMRLDSQSDDSERDTHEARANLLLAALTDTDPATNLPDAINHATPRRLVHRGHVLLGGGRGLEGRSWTAAVLLKTLFSPAT